MKEEKEKEGWLRVFEVMVFWPSTIAEKREQTVAKRASREGIGEARL